MSDLFKTILQKFITIVGDRPQNFESREIATPETRDKKPVIDSLHCPSCGSEAFVRRGFRQKKHERVQLYLCPSCRKTFTAQITKGKRYPLEVVLETISLYNLGYSLAQTCRIIKEKTGLNLKAGSLSGWLAEFEPLCRYFQMRPYVTKKYGPQDVIVHATLAHRQLFNYRYHRGKAEILVENEYQHRRFGPLLEFLALVPAECPHQYFQEGLRASEAPLAFSKTAMIVRGKTNFANRLCAFVLQSVKERQGRHEALQKFMIANDSVTVATEVPVYLTKDDLEHMRTQLGFEIYSRVIPNEVRDLASKASVNKNASRSDNNNDLLPKLITGHIDILQIRNGQIHILDYKPKAEKERPIEQLTLYAMSLSRLTGLRLFEFKCAWFDEKNYFEFFPLHVLHKPKKAQRRRKINTQEGVYLVNKVEEKVTNLRPV